MSRYVLVGSSEIDNHINKDLIIVPDDFDIDGFANQFFTMFKHGEDEVNKKYDELQLSILEMPLLKDDKLNYIAWHDLQDQRYEEIIAIGDWREGQDWFQRDMGDYCWHSHFVKWLVLQGHDVKIIQYEFFNERVYTECM